MTNASDIKNIIRLIENAEGENPNRQIVSNSIATVRSLDQILKTALKNLDGKNHDKATKYLDYARSELSTVLENLKKVQ